MMGERYERIQIGTLGRVPSDSLREVLAFLAPDPSAVSPRHERCDLIELSRASKQCRTIALDNGLWKDICGIRWSGKVGFADRMARAEEGEACPAATCVRQWYWHGRYVAEERRASRKYILPHELHGSTFSFRMWFGKSKWRTIKTKGLPSGLRGESISDKVKFLPDGTIAGLPQPQYAGAEYALNDDGSITFGRLSDQDAPICMLEVRKRSDWGWELRSGAYVIRSIPNDAVGNNVLLKKVWADLSSKIIIQKRKKGVKCYRLGRGRKYNRREVPDVQEVKSFLEVLSPW